MSFQIASEWVHKGGQVITDVSTAKSLTVPDGADSVRIRISGQACHINGDGTAADTNDPIWDTGTYWLENMRTFISNISIIQSAASGRVDVTYFSVKG